MFENPRRSRQARNFTENDPKILDLKSSSEQIMFRKLSLGAPVHCPCPRTMPIGKESYFYKTSKLKPLFKKLFNFRSL